MRAYLPPGVLLLFGAWAGTFYGGAGFAGSVTGAGVLLAVALAAAVRGWVGVDPLGLGRAGRWLLAALLLSVLGSWWASPVPRAGRVGLLLLPACLLLPGAVAAAWREEGARRRGLRTVSAGVALIALWSLAAPLFGLHAGTFERAALPLGHHNLLALWLLAVLPLAVLPAREGSGWRWLGWAAGILGTGALLATRSLLGTAGLGVLALAALIVGVRRGGRPPRMWPAVGGVAAVALVLGFAFGPRLADIASGRDSSAQARAVYWRAGLDGFLERPLVGWGPGATPWTLGAFLRPEPGVNPPGEVVGQLHSQPLQLLYELGAPGLALALAVTALFALRRGREVHRGEGCDRAVALAGLAGLTVAGLALLGTAALDLPAVPVALAVAAGAAWAGAGKGSPVSPRPRGLGIGVALYAITASILLVPLARAHLHYQRALDLDGAAAAREMATAAALDPSFPWYRAWSAWLGGSGPLGRRTAAEPALEAARAAPGVAPLWLMAGVYGLEARAPWADAALARACRLDPLDPLAPFYRMVSSPESPRAPRYGARALLAEPRLLAAVFWDRRPELRAAAVDEIEAWPGVPDGWKVALLQAARTVESAGHEAETARIAATLDRTPATSVALHLFRRRPHPIDLAPVTVHRRQAEAIAMPPASILGETSPSALGSRGCER